MTSPKTTTTLDLDKAPRFAIDDLVTVDGSATRRAVWKVRQILPPTPAQPQYGYYLIRSDPDRKHQRTADEDRLTLVGDQ